MCVTIAWQDAACHRRAPESPHGHRITGYHPPFHKPPYDHISGELVDYRHKYRWRIIDSTLPRIWPVLKKNPLFLNVSCVHIILLLCPSKAISQICFSQGESPVPSSLMRQIWWCIGFSSRIHWFVVMFPRFSNVSNLLRRWLLYKRSVTSVIEYLIFQISSVPGDWEGTTKVVREGKGPAVQCHHFRLQEGKFRCS